MNHPNMKRILSCAAIALFSFGAYSQTAADPTLMTVDGQPVSRSVQRHE